MPAHLSSETKSPARASRIADPEGATAAWGVSASGGDLLAKGEDFDSNVSAALDEDPGGGNQGEDDEP